MVKIIKTDSYFNIFPLLTKLVANSPKDLEHRNLVFCEEKVSLMTERWLCSQLQGSFNTNVYSFGKFLMSKKKFDNLLSREGSAMVIKRILSNLNLECFQKSKNSLPPALYELFILLKSAGIAPDNLENAIEQSSGILKSKLQDIYVIYSAYEKYLVENGLEDSSSQLKYLPDILENMQQLSETDVYVIGYNGWTKQVRDVIKVLVNKSKSFTAILPYGENKFVFVNETVQVLEKIAQEAGQRVVIEEAVSERSEQAKMLLDRLFSPRFVKNEQVEADNVYCLSAVNTQNEFEKVAGVIAKKVREENLRFKDFSVVLPDISKKETLIRAFNLYEVPYFIDDKYSVENHPLISLILSYIEVFRKNFRRKEMLNFIKNPLVCADKEFLDEFENYVIKYDVEFGKFKKPFNYDDENTTRFEEFRSYIMGFFNSFNARLLIQNLNVKEKIEEANVRLEQLKKPVEVSINCQIYGYVTKILDEIERILKGEQLSILEFKTIFLSGASAIKLSVIPQYNDAVFVGGFKEVGLARSEYVFVSSLTSAVPAYQEDVAILSDNDITSLSNLPLGIKVVVGPKIQVINERLREETAMGLTSFNKGLFLSYPVHEENGKQNIKSEILIGVKKLFTVREFPKEEEYLTYAQGVRNFSADCGKFALGEINDITSATAFYNVLNCEKLKEIAEYSNKELKIRLSSDKKLGQKHITSATTIENYYRCPYKTFVEKTLKVDKREEGKMDALSYGTIVHEIICAFMKEIDNIDNSNFDSVFLRVANQITSSANYLKFFDDTEKKFALTRLLAEAKLYCEKNLKWLESGEFKIDKDNLEVKFGDEKDCKYKSVQLLDGKAKLSGTIDRVDFYKDYFRIIDYKTGSIKDKINDLYVGIKLQLYLYSLAIPDKKCAGAYYMPISDEYCKKEDKNTLVIGKTLEDEQLLLANDRDILTNQKSEFLPSKKSRNKLNNTVTEEQMESLREYAKKVSELAVKQMEEGVILPSPYDGECRYCQLNAVCGVKDDMVRKESRITADKIKEAVDNIDE